ncbi:EamA family transporter [Paracoccus sp. PARArs4]|uniref:DMT family transporter n=1 Tax=Paracoccus sp. PARArs4 TaxID=2853442 RepID=UPI0024A6A00C|nr:EamA family transporter [Paracoccus sp. PARArs4]
MSAHSAGVIFCLVAATLWGTTGTVASLAPEVPAIAIGAAAMGVGGLLQALIALGAMRRARAALLANPMLLALGAVAVAIYPLAFYSSMRMAGVTIGTVISIGSAPLISALIENRLDGQRLTARWAVGAAIGLLGMGLLSMAEGGHHDLAPNVPLGVGLGLVAGGTYAAYSWCARRIMQSGVRSRAAMGAIFGLGGLLLMPVLALSGGAFLGSAGNFAVGAYMALVPMFLGYVAFGLGLAAISTSLATTITLFEPVVAAILAVVIVGERLPAHGWVGVGLIVACLFWTTAPLPRLRRAGMRRPP